MAWHADMKRKSKVKREIFAFLSRRHEKTFFMWNALNARKQTT